MSSVMPKVPKIDWSEGVARHWVQGNPSCTHFFNTISLMTPHGEKFFIDSVRSVTAEMELAFDPELSSDVEAFILQELSHSNQHRQYNAILQQSFGLKKIIYNSEKLYRIAKRHTSALTQLGFVCGYEHCTAVLGNYLLSNQKIFSKADSRMVLLWCWHAVEEIEHKSVCFNLYQAAGGGWLRRVLCFLAVTVESIVSFSVLWLYLLWKDDCLRHDTILKTVSDSVRLFLGRNGVNWELLRWWWKYLSPAFHPEKNGDRQILESWIAANQDKLQPLHNMGKMKK